MKGFFQQSVTILAAVLFLTACGAEEIESSSKTKGSSSYGDLFSSMGGGSTQSGYSSDPNSLLPKTEQIKDFFGDTQGEAILNAILAIGRDDSETLTQKQLDQLGQAIVYMMAANDQRVTQYMAQLSKWMAAEMQKLKNSQNKGLIRSFFRQVVGFLTQIVNRVVSKLGLGAVPLPPISN